MTQAKEIYSQDITVDEMLGEALIKGAKITKNINADAYTFEDGSSLVYSNGVLFYSQHNWSN
jgi:hypothetical protein